MNKITIIVLYFSIVLILGCVIPSGELNDTEEDFGYMHSIIPNITREGAYCLNLVDFQLVNESVADFNEEYVTIKNQLCDENAEIGNVILYIRYHFLSINDTGEGEYNYTNYSEAGNHTYIFPNISLAPNGTVTLYSGCGEDSETELYWCIDFFVWSTVTNVKYSENTTLINDYFYLPDNMLYLSDEYGGKGLPLR